MKSVVSPRFWDLFYALPDNIQQRARRAYIRWKANPDHPGLNFERLQTRRPYYSVRISQQYRAIGLRDGDTMLWIWIGPHDTYERLIAGLQ